MGFDWEGSVEHYGDALDAIAARMITMAGILWGRPVETLPRRLYLEILSILRPAEFALRRLIVMAAWKVVPFRELATAKEKTGSGLPLVKEESPQLEDGTLGARQRRACGEELKGGTKTPYAPLPPDEESENRLGKARDFNGLAERTATAKCRKSQDHQSQERGTVPSSGFGHSRNARVPYFPIFDPWKRYGPPFLTEEQIAALNDPNRVPLPPRPVLDPDELVPARTLCRRVRAFANALLNLDHHIDRMSRWRARRAAQSKLPWKERTLRRLSPIRPGVPPGYRERPKTLVGETLKDCHILALDALNSS
ncbi:hypothetical protein [Oricola cellulosilytica]|uniref:Uncharacterized protein n=1 Tax=Oricola cellulosilytica TaxID=1429082 RepID=A0A4R0PEI5_9HYPH|nr:hypothetical protein [Oricola cellulosilytica]TCD13783.1 hypothetical protein E0D97_11815 [Oricola cellulosilytica]